MNRREMRDEEEKLTPWAQAAFEAHRAATGGAGTVPWDFMDVLERRPWVEVADAVLAGYDDEWRSVKAGL